jgi:hypothetical protein
MRFLAAFFLCLCLAVPAQAAPVDKFGGDRYVIAYGGGYAADVAKEVRRQRAKKPKRAKKKVRRPVIKAPPLTLARGVKREVEYAFQRTPFIRGRLVCARNVEAALAARGIKGTGSALAKSYLAWGRASGPVPGAVAIFHRGRRGGHVAIVHSVVNGRVIYLNPSARRQAWVIGPYRKRAIAYRVAA